jgi:hypothetical protein
LSIEETGIPQELYDDEEFMLSLTDMDMSIAINMLKYSKLNENKEFIVSLVEKDPKYLLSANTEVIFENIEELYDFTQQYEESYKYVKGYQGKQLGKLVGLGKDKQVEDIDDKYFIDESFCRAVKRIEYSKIEQQFAGADNAEKEIEEAKQIIDDLVQTKSDIAQMQLEQVREDLTTSFEDYMGYDEQEKRKRRELKQDMDKNKK